MTGHAEREMQLERITDEVIDEAMRSITKHGEQNHLPLGTGRDTEPLSTYDVGPELYTRSGLWPGMLADRLAAKATLDTKAHSANEGGDDTCTWWLILREEVFEAAAEDDPAKLREELIQVAAVALKMIDAIDRPAGAEVQR